MCGETANSEGMQQTFPEFCAQFDINQSNRSAFARFLRLTGNTLVAMSIILTSTWAFAIMRMGLAGMTPLPQARCEQILERARCSVEQVRMVRHRVGDESQFGHDRSLWPRHQPLDVLVSHRCADRRLEGVKFHTHTLSLAPESLLRVQSNLGLGDDTYITSPSLTYQLLSARLPFPRVVLLGLEALGSFHRIPGEGGCTCYGVAPVTTHEALEQGLASLSHAYVLSRDAGIRTHAPVGLRMCQRALPWLREGSASPMEAAIFALLCLPVREGGYGLPFPELNGQIELNSRQTHLTGTRSMRFDFLWREVGLAVEYDSDAYHVEGVTSEKVLRDKRRINAAKLAGIDVLTITRDTVMKRNSFDLFASELAQRLGKRQRALSMRALMARSDLRDLVLYGRIPT